MLTNLIQNALTHGDATEIDINVAAGRKGQASISISDNGSGFAGDFQQLGKLFVRHGRGSGSGVGLYIVRQLIKRMNGDIRFESRAGSGFVAEFNLPEAVTHAAGVPGAETEKLHARGVRTDHEASLAGRR